MKNEKTFLQIAFITFIATLISHSILLTNNGAMWDSLLLVNAKQFGYNSAMKNCIFNTGRRMEYYIALFVFHFPNYVLAMKIISFLMIWFCSIAIYKISNFFFSNNFFVNFGIATLSISFPIYSLWFEPIMFSYTFCMLLFFSAILLYLNTYSSPSVIKKSISFLVVAVLLFWSFEIQSFYVFIYAVLFALFVKEYSKTLRFVSSLTVHNKVSEDTNLGDRIVHDVSKGTNLGSEKKGAIPIFIMNVVAFCKQHFFIILFPIFSFWLWNKLFPISGMAKIYGYNQISFSIKGMVYHFAFSCFKLFVMLPYLLTQLAFHNPITSIISIAVSVLAAWYFFKNIDSKNMVSGYTIHGDKDLTPNSSPTAKEGIQMKFWVIALVSIVFFVAAFLPYNMVGKDYGALNRNCRNGLLAGFGIVIFLVLSIHHLIKKEKYRQWIFTVLFVLFALGSNLSYLFWQNYFVRFQKTEQLFTEHLSAIKTNYMVIHEDCKNPMHQYFVFYEYNFMCKEACGSEKYLALDKHSGWDTKIDTFIKNTELYKPIFMFSKFNNKVDSVTQIHLVSPPNILFDAEKNVWHYWMNNCNAKDYPMQFVATN
ncbi:MAG: hypothetical protein RJA07_1745 [Bacteroidota bacterium]|jgi:membrane protein implicated in regulation of membrane protease activity